MIPTSKHGYRFDSLRNQGTRRGGRLDGKIGIITGVGGRQGIGPATAARFIEEGCRLFVCDLDADAGSEFVRSIDPSGTHSRFMRADVTKEEDVQQLANACDEQFGRPDILVVNAGVARGVEILETTIEDFDKNEGNYRGAFLCCRAICRLMSGGSVILISTVNALIGGAMEGVYAGTKGAMHSFGRSLAIELAPKRVRVNCVVPGTVDARGPNSARRLEKDPEYFQHVALGTVPLGRVVNPRDVADLNLFLASDESCMITGQVIPIDGGTSVAGPYWQIGPRWPDDIAKYCQCLEEYQSRCMVHDSDAEQFSEPHAA